MSFTRDVEADRIIKGLIAINVAVFVLGLMRQVPNMGGEPVPLPMVYGSYSFEDCFDLGEYWRLITYQFVHADMGHILFNMIALWFFGRAVCSMMGAFRFLLFYLGCGVVGALFSSLLMSQGLCMREELAALSEYIPFWKMIPMVGASGSIYGVIAAAAVMFPYARVALWFPPIEMSVRTFALAVLAIALVVIAMNWNNAGGEAGHLGGMLCGFSVMGIWVLYRKLMWNRR